MTIKQILLLFAVYMILRDIVRYGVIPFGKFLIRHHKQMLIDHEQTYRAVKGKE